MGLTTLMLESVRNSGESLTLIRERSEDRLGYEELLEEGLAIGSSLQELGIGPGSRVGVIAAAERPYAVSLWGVLSAGACAVLLPVPGRIGRVHWLDQIGRMLQRARPSHLIGVKPPVDLGVPHLGNIPASGFGAEAEASLDDEAIIQFTSGTTGTPRGVTFSYGAVFERLEKDLKSDPNAPGDSALGWLPLHSSAGFQTMFLRPMVLGMSSHVMATSLFMSRPERWMMEVSRRRATRITGPTFAYGVVAARLEQGLDEPVDLSHVRSAVCSGEKVEPRTVERFLAATAPWGLDPAAFAPYYASTEAGPATRSTGGLKLDSVDPVELAAGRAVPMDGAAAVRVTSLGKPTKPMIGIEIRDADGKALPEREVGEVCIRTPWLFTRYLDEPEETARRIQDGWYLSGDTGYLADGELYMTGRVKNVIIIRSRKFQGEELERLVEDIEGVLPNAVAALGVRDGSTESLAVFAETDLPRARHADLADAIRSHLWETVGLTVARVEVREPETLPRSDAGKLQRELLRED